LDQHKISVFDHKTEVSTVIIQTEGDINILFTHSSLQTYTQCKFTKIISGRKLMVTSVM